MLLCIKNIFERVKKMKIKICGIKQPEHAYAAATAGADFIGLIFVPSSHRAVTVNTARIISQAARDGGAEPVGVFTEASATDMLNICQTANINYVQLHGNYSREQQHLLPDSFSRIYVYPVSAEGNFTLDENIKLLDKKRDYLLFDNHKAGSGKTFDWQKFSYAGDFKWFLSGGLNPNNVKEAIQLFHPTGVDVSSGVENIKGEKDLNLIKKFIGETKL